MASYLPALRATDERARALVAALRTRDQRVAAPNG
jgi:hypothetical protein